MPLLLILFIVLPIAGALRDHPGRRRDRGLARRSRSCSSTASSAPRWLARRAAPPGGASTRRPPPGGSRPRRSSTAPRSSSAARSCSRPGSSPTSIGLSLLIPPTQGAVPRSSWSARRKRVGPSRPIIFVYDRRGAGRDRAARPGPSPAAPGSRARLRRRGQRPRDPRGARRARSRPRWLRRPTGPRAAAALVPRRRGATARCSPTASGAEALCSSDGGCGRGDSGAAGARAAPSSPTDGGALELRWSPAGPDARVRRWARRASRAYRDRRHRGSGVEDRSGGRRGRLGAPGGRIRRGPHALGAPARRAT